MLAIISKLCTFLNVFLYLLHTFGSLCLAKIAGQQKDQTQNRDQMLHFGAGGNRKFIFK